MIWFYTSPERVLGRIDSPKDYPDPKFSRFLSGGFGKFFNPDDASGQTHPSGKFRPVKMCFGKTLVMYLEIFNSELKTRGKF